MATKLSKTHRYNLLMLADYVYKKRDKLSFNMYTFMSFKDEDADGADYADYAPTNKKIYHACGTTACLAGHGPRAGLFGKKHEIWEDYITRVFGIESIWDGDVGEWLFGPGWAEIDNTTKGGAQRIYWYLTNGVPDNSRSQMNGTAPLCYTKMKAAFSNE